MGVWVFGVPQDWHHRLIGRLGEIVCLRCMHEPHGEPSACGKPRTQPRCWPVKAWRCQSGADSQSPISARRNQSIQRWRVDSRLAISRTSCSRLPFCNKRALATVVHRRPSSADITTRSLCAAPGPSAPGPPQDVRFCKCGELLDVHGHHRSACSRIGLLKPRLTPA